MKASSTFPRLTLPLLIASLACLAAPGARAATNWWDGDGLASNNWTTLASWDLAADGSGGDPATWPGASDIAVFNTSAFNSDVIAALSAAQSVGGLVFNNTGTTGIRVGTSGNKALTIGGGGILINEGAGLVTFGTGTANYRMTFTLAGSQSWINNSVNAVAFNARSTLTLAGYALTLGGSGDMSFAANIQTAGGGSSIVKDGTGTITFTGTNWMTGAFTLNDGRVRVGVAATIGAALGQGTLTLNGGTLSGNSTAARTVSNDFTVGGNVTLGHATDSGLLTFAGAGTLTGNRSVTVDSPVVISGAIGDGGGNHLLTKVGTGTLTLSGANTYGGGTQVDAGTLNLANLSAMPFSGTVSVGAGATIALAVDNGNPLTYWTTAEIDALWANSLFGFNLDSGALVGIDTTPGDVAYASSLGSTRGMVKIGANALTLSGNSTFSGGVEVRNGTLVVGSNTALGSGAVTLWTGTILTNAGDVALGNAMILNPGTATVGVTDGSAMTFTGDVSGPGILHKRGDGTLTLSGAVNTSSNVILYGGTVTLGGTAVFNTWANNVDLVQVRSNSTLNIAGDVVFASRLRLGYEAGTTAVVNQTSGNVVYQGDYGILIGNATDGGAGIYNLSGGSISNAAGAEITLGLNARSTAIFNMSGGTLYTPTLEVGRNTGAAAGSTNYFTQSGGTATVATLVMGRANADGAGMAMYLLVTNGTFTVTTGFTTLAPNADQKATLYFGPGADVTLPAMPITRGAGAVVNLTLDGNRLTPAAASTSYMTNLTSAAITDNGVTLDVPTGRNITVGQSLEDASGDNGVLRKAGAGILTLAGANTYSGGTVVSNGMVILAVTAAKPGTGTMNVLAGGALGLRVGGAGFFSVTDVDNLWANALAGVSMDAAARVGIDTTEGDLTYGTAQSTRGLVKLGANILTLTGDSTYAGGTEILNGILQVGNGGATGSLGAGNVLNNAALVINRSGAYEIPGDITGTGALTNIGPGTVTLSGSNQFAGRAIVRDGTMNVTGSLLSGNEVRVGIVAGQPADLNLMGDAYSSGSTFYLGTGDSGATGTVRQTSGTLDITGNLQAGSTMSSGGLFEFGGGAVNVSGTIILAYNNNCVGVFGMTDGVLTGSQLQVGRDATGVTNVTAYYHQSGGTSTVGTLRIGPVVDSDSRFAVSGGVFAATSFGSLSSRIGSTSVVYLGQGALVTLGAFPTARGASNTWTELKLDGVTLTPVAASTSYMTNLNQATITANGVMLDVPTGRDITIGQILADDGVDNGFLTKTGAGTLRLYGVNTYSGGTIVSNGTLALGATNALGAGGLTMAAGTVLSGAASSLVTNDIAQLGAITLDAAAGVVMTLNGNLAADSGTLLSKTGAGSVILGGTNWFTGAVTLKNGTVRLSGNARLAEATAVVITNGATLSLDNSAVNIGNRIADAAAVRLAGGAFDWTHDAAAAAAYSESLGALELKPGANLIFAARAAVDGTSLLTFASLARDPGATLRVEAAGLGVDNRNRIVFTAAPTTLNGLIPWMALKTGTGGTGADWDLAEYDGIAGLKAPTYEADEANWTAATVNGRPAADQAVGGNRVLNALVLDDGVDLLGPLGDRSLSFDGASGAAVIFQTGGFSAITNSGNNGHNLLFGANEGVFNVLGDLWITRGNDNNATLRGTNGFAKIGPGTLILQSGSQAGNATMLNNMLGLFSIEEGTLQLRRPDAAGGAVLDLNGGTLMLVTNSSSVFTSYDATPTNTPLVVSQSGTVIVARAAAGGGVTHTMGNLTLKDGVQLTLSRGANFNDNNAPSLRFDTVTLLGGPTLNLRMNSGSGDGVMYATNLTDNGSGYDLAVNGTSVIRSELRVLNTLTLGGNLSIGAGGAGAAVRAADGFANVAGNILVGSGVLASGADFTRELGDGAGQVRFIGGYTAGISAGGAAATFAFTQGGVTGMLAWGAPNFQVGSFQMNEDDAGAQVTLLNGLDLNSGAIDVARQITVDNNTAFVPGVVTNTGSALAGLTKAGAGWLWLTGPLGYNGATRVTGGYLRIPDVSSLPAGNLYLNSDNAVGVLETAGTFMRALGVGEDQVQLVSPSTGTENGRLGFSAYGGDLTVDIGGNGTGTGPALLWNTAHFDPEGASTTNGAMFLNSSAANGTLHLLNSIDLNGTGEAGVTDRRIEVSGGLAILHGAVVNNGGSPMGFQKRGTGTLVLGADNSYDGGTYVLNGVLVVGAGGTTGTLGAGDVTNRTGSALAFNRSNSHLVDNMIVGAGTVAQIGSGTLTLSANNSYTGPTIVSNGILRINGAHSGPGLITVAGGTLGGTGSVAGAILVQSGAKLAPGASPGIFTANGDVTLDGGSTFEVELNGLAMGTEYDHLAMGTGTSLTLTNPTLLVQLGFSPAIDDTFQIVAGFLNLSGTFNGLPDDATFTTGGTEFRIDYNTSDITLTVVPEPSSLGLFGLLAAAVLLRRRTRR
jgi:autotransporter-associated beta strand protein